MKRFATALILMLIPVIAINAVKETRWGPLLSTPKGRQLGDPGAKVTIVEYSDFQCPSCAKMQQPVHSYMDLYKGKIRLMYKYYPLTKIHKHAMAAAHAAECAAAQQQFWPYHDQLFARQDFWAPLADATTTFMAIAQETHLDIPQFQACLADLAKEKPIEKDAEEAKNRQVNSTPTFFIGDERVVGAMFATDGARLIEKELRK